MTDISERAAYVAGHLTRQQFIEAQWRIAERKKRFEMRLAEKERPAVKATEEVGS